MTNSFLKLATEGNKAAILKQQIICQYILGGDSSITDLSKAVNLSVPTVTKLIGELIDEGFLREVISKVQTMRKDADFEVTEELLYDRLLSVAKDAMIDVAFFCCTDIFTSFQPPTQRQHFFCFKNIDLFSLFYTLRHGVSHFLAISILVD